MIAEVILGGILKTASDWLSEQRKAQHLEKASIDDSHARSALLNHIRWLEQWASSISMLNLRQDKKLSEAFVELTLDVGFFRYYEIVAEEKSFSIDQLHRSEGHVAILGRPGAGKTTSLQRMATLLLTDRENGSGGVPILVMLRDIRDGEGLFSHLLAKLGIIIRNSPDVDSRHLEQQILLGYLDKISAVLLLDGLDEVDPASRRVVETELRDLALNQGEYRVILTCRTAEYTVDLKNVQAYTLRPLSPQKVIAFAHRWLGEKAGDEFVEAISRNPYAGTEVVPLTLAHLCAIYERDGSLPPRPIDVYEAIVSLLVEQWDRERGIARVSQYADFSPRKKERFLQATAFELAMAGRKGVFRDDDLHRIYRKIANPFGLPPEEETAVITEIESHTGLILQSGYRRYEFAHLVIQEFLTAMHAQRTPNGIAFLVPGFPNEAALVTAYSTSADEYIEEILKLLVEFHAEDETHYFIGVFAARLATENVTVRVDARAGWVLLGLLDLMSHRSENTGRFPWVLVEEMGFFLSSQARSAISLAVAQARLTARGAAVRIDPSSSADVPEFIRARADAEGFVIRHEGGFSQSLPGGWNADSELW